MGVSVREKVKGSGVWWLFIRHNGIRRSKQIGPKREAQRLAKQVIEKLALGELRISSTKVKTFKHYAEIWLNGTVTEELKPSTQDDYRHILNKHVCRAGFFNKPVDQIKKTEIKNFLMKKRRLGLSISTVTHIKNVCGGIFNEAIEDEVISTNPSHGIKLGTKAERSTRTPKIEPLSVDEVNVLIAAYRQHKPEYQPLIQLLVSTGMRIGEASALQWQDVDFNDRSILVRRNYVRNRLEDSTKSGKDRRVDMPPQLVDTLRSLKSRKAAASLKAGQGSIEKSWLFCSIRDPKKPLNYQTWRRDVFYPVLETAGVRKVRVHDLRHTFASMMIESGCNLVYLRDQLGHSSITVTADVYGHLLKGDNEKPVDALDKTLRFLAP